MKAPDVSKPTAVLDKRRARWVATVQVATSAEEVLAGLDRELEANAVQRAASRAELAAAVARAAELEKEIKALATQRERLRADRQRAKARVKKNRRRVKVTEKKFDKALLADMLRKARTAALATNGAAPRRAAPASRARSAATPRRTTANARAARG